jgi:hypothetical protein
MLSEWESFYVIVGSAGGALIGIQFVVMTLIANMRQRPTYDTLDAFGTPTVVHLTGALVVSAIMSAPWFSLGATSLALGACGLGGLAYSVVIVVRARRQTAYKPVWQDWVWHGLLPLVVYAALALTALLLRRDTHVALFGVGAAALGLLLIGIHNAWDTIEHIVITQSADDGRSKTDS